MICIVNNGLGNVGSIVNMYRRLGIGARLTRDPETLASAERLILPGVGAFDRGMQNLEALGLKDVLSERVQRGIAPCLGICLGMQLMTHSSEEGSERGLGWIDAKTVHIGSRSFLGRERIRLPHIGWNFVDIVRDHPLVSGLTEEPRFYFVHSYCVECSSPDDRLFVARYEDVELTAGFVHENVAGVQFHPEKSHRFGMQLLRNFAEWRP